MKEKLIPFDIVECLDSPEVIVAYLRQVLADGDMTELYRAMEHCRKAIKMTEEKRALEWIDRIIRNCVPDQVEHARAIKRLIEAQAAEIARLRAGK